jgi:hypothetical protein
VDGGESVPFGEPRGVILGTAEECGADLIVVGSHGRRGLDRFLPGTDPFPFAKAPISLKRAKDAEEAQLKDAGRKMTDLAHKIMTYIRLYNGNAQPFRWTYRKFLWTR